MHPDLQADRIRVTDLDAQILELELERTLYTIRAEKALVQNRLDSYKYPVLQLPNEIISEIFVHFLPVYPACPPLIGVASPTNLTQICRKWREVALATPLLWRAIRLDLRSNTPAKQQAEKIDLWLRSMSGCCPISLDMWGYNLSLESTALAALAPHHARWEHMRLDLEYIPHDRLLFTHPMPLLRHLDLDLNDYSEEGDEVSHPIVLGEAPLLHSVILDDVAAKKFVLPWAQLTSLTLRDARSCAAILQHTPNLVHCNLDFTAETGTFPNFALSHLESLVLTDFDPDTTNSDYLGHFVLPALRDLRTQEILLGPSPRDSLASFISKSGCKLQKIHIEGPRIVSQDAYGAVFPSIQFSFNGSYDGPGTEVASDTDSSDVENDNEDVEDDTENDTESSDVEDD